MVLSVQFSFGTRWHAVLRSLRSQLLPACNPVMMKADPSSTQGISREKHAIAIEAPSDDWCSKMTYIPTLL